MRKLLVVSFLLLSSRAYAAWSPPIPISQPGDCWDPQVIAAGDTLHVVYENTSAGDKISYVRSTDAGISWSTPVRLTETRGATLHPRIIRDNQNLIALWKQIFNSGYDRFNIGYTISSDGGSSWDSARYIFYPNWAGIQNMAAAGVGPDVDVIVGTQVAYDFIYYDIHSTNFGTTWSEPQQMFACLESNRLDCAASQELVSIAWSGRFDTSHEYEVYNTNSFDLGMHWTPNEVLSDTDQYHSQIPAIAIDSLVKIEVCWMDFKYAPPGATGDIFFRQSHDSGSNWDQTIELIRNHKAFQSDLAVSGDTIDLVWDDESHGMFHTIIQYVRSTDGGINWCEPYWIDSTIYHNSSSPALAVSNDRVYVVWNAYGGMPDSSALYFSYSPYEPDAVGDTKYIDLPDNIELSAYPNPFNSATTITLTGVELAEIGIYDITGRLITTLHTVGGQALWDAGSYSSGLYFARAAGEKPSVIKLILLR
jgi:hypothetical protein